MLKRLYVYWSVGGELFYSETIKKGLELATLNEAFNEDWFYEVDNSGIVWVFKDFEIQANEVV